MVLAFSNNASPLASYKSALWETVASATLEETNVAILERASMYISSERAPA
jgi:hypothetical protein